MKDEPLQPDPVIEAYKRDIDRSLLRENLKLTVEQRFLELMKLQEFAEELQRAMRAASDAAAEVQVYSGDKLAMGTVRWKAPRIPGYHLKQYVPAVPAANGPDVYVVDESDDGNTTLIRALFADGRQKWMKKVQGKVDKITSSIIQGKQL